MIRKIFYAYEIVVYLRRSIQKNDKNTHVHTFLLFVNITQLKKKYVCIRTYGCLKAISSALRIRCPERRLADGRTFVRGVRGRDVLNTRTILCAAGKRSRVHGVDPVVPKVDHALALREDVVVPPVHALEEARARRVRPHSPLSHRDDPQRPPIVCNGGRGLAARTHALRRDRRYAVQVLAHPWSGVPEGILPRKAPVYVAKFRTHR